MKHFFTTIAANLVTIAVVVVFCFILVIGIIASAAGSKTPALKSGSILVIDLDHTLVDAPAEAESRGPFQDALEGGGNTVPLRSAIMAVRGAASDERVSGILIRGSVNADGYGSGYAALKEMREAIAEFRANSKKPVHAYLVNPGTKDYYVASAASVITLDPFGALMVPGLSAEEMFLSGFFEKYGIGMQVSRVGRFKSAVEPYTRSDMSPESRLQLAGYLGDIWGEVKRGIAASRGVDTVQFQALVDSVGIVQPAEALAARLVDRVAYFDVVLRDLEALSKEKDKVVEKGDGAAPQQVAAKGDTKDAAKDVAKVADKAAAPASLAAVIPTLPQIALDEYAPIAVGRAQQVGAKQAVAIVYAEGDIVDGQGGPGSIGGDALARELRRLRSNKDIRAVVLRVNSPGGSAIASETIQRELALIKAEKPVVVSMGTVAASGGYWISTAASRVFAEPNTITGSIGVFSLVPNLKGLANRNGITFDTVKTGRYADLFTIARPRTPAEMAVLQRGVDAVYSAFIARVSAARHLPADSVRAIAEGRVWSGEDALRIGLVDSIGGLDVAVRSAATLANIVGDYAVRELPHHKSAAEMLSEFFEHKTPPVASIASRQWAGNDPVRTMARDVFRELEVLLAYNDPRGVYARLPFVLRVR